MHMTATQLPADAPGVCDREHLQHVNEGDRIRFTPSAACVAALRYNGSAIEGVVITADKVSGDQARHRYRIRTDADAPQGGGKIERTVYSNDGVVELLARSAHGASDAPAQTDDADVEHDEPNEPDAALKEAAEWAIEANNSRLLSDADRERAEELGYFDHQRTRTARAGNGMSR